MMDRMTSAITSRVACKALHPMIRRSIAANQPHFSHYVAINGPAYDAHPRTIDPANNVCDPAQGVSNSGWKVPGAEGERSCDPHTIVVWFNVHVRDALAFNY